MYWHRDEIVIPHVDSTAEERLDGFHNTSQVATVVVIVPPLSKSYIAGSNERLLYFIDRKPGNIQDRYIAKVTDDVCS